MDAEFCKYNKVYSTNQEQLILNEFERLKGEHYLEHAGATLYSEKQMENVVKQLTGNLYTNPHARNISSKSTEDAVDIIRYQVLSHFNTNPEEYSIIFTSGATASLKTIAEYFIYKNGTFAYLDDNHTSAVGMREYAKNIKPIKQKDALKALTTDIKLISDGVLKESNSLFVYPAQSNFSGTKYPLSWINSVKNGALNKLTGANSHHQWFVVLDAACYVATNQLDLSQYKPDFVTISFYKMFGYPTGLGALLVKNSSAQVLDKVYFGGGTVQMILSTEHEIVPRITLHERFEDGTLPFLSILALKHGFDTLNRLNLNFQTISLHVFCLAQYVYKNLLIFHHSNGNPVAELYHDANFESSDVQGGIVNFNLLRPNGEFVGYSEVLHISNLFRIHLRTGCFCNPGACQRFLQLKAGNVRKHFKAGHVCGDQFDLIDGYPTGSVRISFGYMSTKDDADQFLEMIRTCFIAKPIVFKIRNNYNLIQPPPAAAAAKEMIAKEHNKDFVTLANSVRSHFPNKHVGVLEHIFLYPIKSCGAFAVLDNWPITSTGLKYDRQWMIVNSAGVCFTQKHNRHLCLIKPSIDVESDKLILSFSGREDISLPLNTTTSVLKPSFPCQSKVCGDQIQGWDCGEDVAQWLSKALNCPGLRLLKHFNDDLENKARFSKSDDNKKLSLVNKAQYLLINSSSVEWLREKIPENGFTENLLTTIHRFRSNFVVNFGVPFIEDDMQEFQVNDVIFDSGGKCTRCQMICINQLTAKSTKEPLQTLSKEFKGKIAFGIYLNAVNVTEVSSVSVGAKFVGFSF